MAMHRQLDWLAMKQAAYRRQRDHLMQRLEHAAAAAAAAATTSARGRLLSQSGMRDSPGRQGSTGHSTPVAPRSRASSYIAIHEGTAQDGDFQIVTVSRRLSRSGAKAPLDRADRPVGHSV